MNDNIQQYSITAAVQKWTFSTVPNAATCVACGALAQIGYGQELHEHWHERNNR